MAQECSRKILSERKYELHDRVAMKHAWGTGKGVHNPMMILVCDGREDLVIVPLVCCVDSGNPQSYHRPTLLSTTSCEI